MAVVDLSTQRRGVWDEASMCDIEERSPTRRTGSRIFAGALREEVNARNVDRAASNGRAHELTRGASPSVVYGPEGVASHGNFIKASYRRIMARDPWRRRLEKAHTAKRQARPTGQREEVRAWRELDAATSSDALLMNVFCYPRVWSRALCGLLGVPPGCVPQFGYKPRAPLTRGLVDCTEIDMRLGSLLVEAKLTEGDFQRAPMRLLERYMGLDEVFDREALEVGPRGVEGYQVVRGVMAAQATGGTFCLLCDARRPDLIEIWFRVVRAVRSFALQGRMRVVTWQEIARVVPAPLRSFLREKYGI